MAIAISSEEFYSLVESIKKNTELIVAEEPDKKYYLGQSGTTMSDHLANALDILYPSMEEANKEILCLTLGGFLERPCLDLKYTANKKERDALLSSKERFLIDESITRATNIRQLHTIVQLILGDEYSGFLKTISRLYSNQLKSMPDNTGVENAKLIRVQVYEFCTKLITKAKEGFASRK